LAVRCLSYTGQFDPFVSVLNDESQRSFWAAHFDALQDALARGVETAALARSALEKDRGDDAPELYRLLWGYSPDDLRYSPDHPKAGSAAQLVEYLDHEQLDFRVLSFENLRRITGFQLYYSPHHTAARRHSPVQKWRQRLKEGKVIYKNPPLDIPPRNAPELDTP
jgi:hypothetical protein